MWKSNDLDLNFGWEKEQRINVCVLSFFLFGFSLKGMVLTAVYLKAQLESGKILEKAFNHSKERGTETYRLVIVGHSLGAGTATILAVLLKEQYPNLQCYAYSPPGGLLRYFRGSFGLFGVVLKLFLPLYPLLPIYCI